MDPKRRAFFDSLVRDDLVFATTLSSNFVHVLRLTSNKAQGRKHAVESDQCLWLGRTFCKSRSRYYFTPLPASEVSERGLCKVCFSGWRSRGKPPLKDLPPSKIDPGARPLPFGWQAVEPIGHPHDVPPGGDVERVVDLEGKVVGELRTERFRWMRGGLVVRIVEYHHDESVQESPYGVLYHHVSKPSDESWIRKGSLESCKKKAHELMAIGGVP